ncbi:MAG: hypothetical protein ACXVPM_20040 [Bacteroidia bacterium]
MTRILTFIIFFATFCCPAQNNFKLKVKKQFGDTIDYSNLKAGVAYNLTIVKQFNGQQIYDMTGRQIVFLIRTALNDTLIYMPWDSDYRDIHKTQSHATGVIHLNKKNNTISCSKNGYDKKTKQTVTKKKAFKIIKWTFYELIIKDVTNVEFNRIYYFKRGIAE